MITITGKKGVPENSARIAPINGLFPELYLSERPYATEKPVLFFVARAYAAETPSSVVIEALLEFLTTSGDP